MCLEDVARVMKETAPHQLAPVKLTALHGSDAAGLIRLREVLQDANFGFYLSAS